MEVVGLASDAVELHALVDQLSPEVVITDIRMPPTNTTEGLEAARRIRAERPDVGVLVLSHHVETHQADELLGDGSGRVGYLLKDRVSDLREFVESIRRIGAGGSVIDPEVVARLLKRRREHDPLEVLTEREREIFALMAEGGRIRPSRSGCSSRRRRSSRTSAASSRSSGRSQTSTTTEG